MAGRCRRSPVLILLAAAFVGGCGPREEQSATRATRPGPAAIRASPSSLDPCAERLHELAGPLLLLWARDGRLPAGPARLAAMAPEVPLVCPVSGQPYRYDPHGPWLPGQAGRLVLYDSTPAHQGHRWGLILIPAEGRQPPATAVILLAEGTTPPSLQ